MEPLISVIVPVFNMAALLPRCVDSILGQTCNDIEIILVNDGSTDGTGALCTRYAQEHNNITAIHQENRGVSAARNAGITVARGRYLGFVDSDDWIEPEMYEILLKTLQKHDSKISACGYIYNRFDGVYNKNNVDINTPDCLELEAALKSLISPNGIQGFVWNKLFARELLLLAGDDKYLLFDERVKICEDLLFVSRCIEVAGRIAYDKRPLYVYCVRDYGGLKDYNRERRFSELIALESLIISWTKISASIGELMKRHYTKQAWFILLKAAAAGDCKYLPIMRNKVIKYLKPFLLSREVKFKYKIRILITLVIPRFENKLRKIIKGW